MKYEISPKIAYKGRYTSKRELHARKSLNVLNRVLGKIKRHSAGGAGVSLREYRKEQQKIDEKMDRIFNILQELYTN